MSVLNQVCSSWSDIESQLKDFQAELLEIESEVGSAVKEAVADDGELDKIVDSAISNVDGFFAFQQIGSLNAALKDANIRTPDSDASKSMEDLGFLRAGSRYWLCNSSISSNPNLAESNYGYVGIGAGEFEPDQISNVLGREYIEPDSDSITSMLRRASGISTNTSTIDLSVTGSRTNTGNISTLREFHRGCSSDLAILRQFVSDAYSAGFGVLWSTSHVLAIPRPAGMLDGFDASWIRNSIGQVVFNDDMEFVSDYCYVRVESYVGHNISKQEAEARLEKFVARSGLVPGSCALLARTLIFHANEDVKNSAPMFVSRGCDPSLLTTDKHILGLAVNGIYRAIDVTGDLGRNIVRETYSVRDIVDSISEVFGDLVETGVVGDEFFVRLKSGFGSAGSLTLFYTGDQDCSNVIGTQNAVYESAYALGSSRSSVSAYDLSVVREVAFSGGASSITPVSGSYMLDYLNAGNLSPTQTSCVLTRANYWDAVTSTLESLKSDLEYACTSGDESKKRKAVVGIENALCFFDAHDFSYREFLTLYSAFGNDLNTILINKMHILSIETYISEASVRDALAKVVSDIADAEGIVLSSGTWSTSSLPLELNYAMAARIKLLHSISTQYAYLDDMGAEVAATQMCAYASSLSVANNVMITKTNPDTSFAKIMDGMEELTKAINGFNTNDLNRVLWNTLKEIPGVSEIFDAASYTQSKLDRLGEGIDAGIRGIEDTLSDIVNSLGLDSAQRVVIRVLMAIKSALSTAQTIVNNITSLYNATTKKIYALSNFNLNFAGSLGIQTKYLSCYASGGISATPLLFLAKMIQNLNDAADKLNKKLAAMRKAAQTGMDKIICMLDKLVLSLTGTMIYESTMQAGMVSLKFQCTSYVNLSSEFDPKILQHVMDIRRQIDFLMASMRLEIVTFQKHKENIDATASTFSATLEDTVNDILGRFRTCF